MFFLIFQSDLAQSSIGKYFSDSSILVMQISCNIYEQLANSAS
jgi:hypothetical protein